MPVPRITAEYTEVVIEQAEAVPKSRVVTEYVEVVLDQPEVTPKSRVATMYVEVIILTTTSKAYWGTLSR